MNIRIGALLYFAHVLRTAWQKEMTPAFSDTLWSKLSKRKSVRNAENRYNRGNGSGGKGYIRMDQKTELEYQEQIQVLQKELMRYRQEIDRLEEENSVLHETAWGLVRQLSKQEGGSAVLRGSSLDT